jgi:molybdate/tungstate transport system substrate-binding protein
VLAATLLVLTQLGACKSDRKEVVVFAAALLARAFSDLEQQLEKEQPSIDIKLTFCGSQEACRKVAELNDRADVVAAADYRIVESILRPSHAAFNIQFATNEIVLAHLQHSKHTEEVSADNWPTILLRPEVRLGTVAPDQARIGYATLLVWQLAELHLGQAKLGPDLSGRLRGRCRAEHVASDESELLKLLEARAIDYAFMYRSTAEEHRLKVVRLPDAYSLGAAEQTAVYARASVRVRMKRSESLKEIRGAPILYGVTIPREAPNPEGAVLVVRQLLEETGRRTLERTGFVPLRPARCAESAALPASLRALVR